MTLSIWRYSHLLLAISSCLFLFVASVTGVILAIEPISDTIHANSVIQGKNISLAKTIESLQQNYDEIFTIEINENQGVIVSAIDNEGNDQKVFVDPFTGNQLGAVPERAKIFKFSTNLHRSLFLKSTGRYLIGFVSF